VLVAAPQQPDGSRPIAVVDRDWLEAAIVRSLLAQGARSVAAVPAQLCLPLQPGSVSAAIQGAELTLRQGLFQGFGLALDAVPAVVLQTARAFSGDAPLVLYVPRGQLGEYQALRWPTPAPASRWKPTTGRTGSPARRAPRSTW
jgi:general secretion pathway protein L